RPPCFVLLSRLRPLLPISTLFPYPTLFRSRVGHDLYRLARLGNGERLLWVSIRGEWQPMYRFDLQPQLPIDFEAANFQLCMDPRSEEHTSELQSRENLVCRLLLEKNNATDD